MTDEQANKDICEQVVKKCWHENITFDEEGYGTCSKCNATDFFNSHVDAIKVSFQHPDYLNNWNDYGELIKVVMEHNEIKHLISDDRIPFAIVDHWAGYSEIWFRDYMFNPRKGSMAIWEVFCKKNEGKQALEGEKK